MEELQARVASLALSPEKFLETVPPAVRARVAELSKLQDQHDELEEAFRKELAELEAKYEKQYAPLLAERAGIVSGEKAVPLPPGTADEGGPGIPGFWLTVLMRFDGTREMMNEKDFDVLKYLTDIQAETLTPTAVPAGEGEEDEGEEEKVGGFRLRFVFAENPYFTNKELTKTYYMMDSEEPVLERAEGTDIDWKPGKNVTKKVLKKKPKKGAKPDAKPQTKTEDVPSFFNFFTPPDMPEDDAEMEEEDMEALHEEIEQDYDIGSHIREKLVPHAVGWYTGEALEDEDCFQFGEDDEDEEGEEDEDEDDEDEDDDDDDSPAPAKQITGGKRKGGRAGAPGEQPQECKQQ